MAFGFEFRDDKGNLMFREGEIRYTVMGRRGALGTSGSLPIPSRLKLNDLLVNIYYTFTERGSTRSGAFILFNGVFSNAVGLREVNVDVQRGNLLWNILPETGVTDLTARRLLVLGEL